MQDEPSSEEYKLTEDDFLQQYAANDTAAAIIHLYFTRRNKGLLITNIFATTGTAIATIDRVQQRPQQGPYGQTTPERAGWVLPALTASIVPTLGGLLYAAGWSRISCYRLLRRYKALGLRELTPGVRRNLPAYLEKVHSGQVSW